LDIDMLPTHACLAIREVACRSPDVRLSSGFITFEITLGRRMEFVDESAKAAWPVLKTLRCIKA
jgi:hypothetical protein